MNRIDNTLRAATRRALVIGLLAALAASPRGRGTGSPGRDHLPRRRLLSGTDGDDTLQGTAGSRQDFRLRRGRHDHRRRGQR